jgi:hypothetical protein
MNKLRLDFILENFLQWFELFQYQINSSKQIISNKHELLSLFQEEISKNAITVILLYKRQTIYMYLYYMYICNYICMHI